MPGATDLGRRFAQGALLRRDRRRLAQVFLDHRAKAQVRERLEHVEQQARRVDREQTAALLDPISHGDRVLGLGLQLVVQAFVVGRPVTQGLARMHRPLDVTSHLLGFAALDQVADE